MRPEAIERLRSVFLVFEPEASQAIGAGEQANGPQGGWAKSLDPGRGRWIREVHVFEF
jgi:hypothetical protein